MIRNRLGMRLGMTLMALGILCLNAHCDDGLGGTTSDLNATIERIVHKMSVNGGTTPVTNEPQQELAGDGPVYETLPH